MKVSLVLLLLGVFVLTAALPQGRPDEEETEQEEDTIGETAIEGGEEKVLKRQSGLPWLQMGLKKTGDNQYRYIACEGQKGIIYCPDATKRMYITYANYGRTYPYVCDRVNWTKCYSIKSTTMFANTCHNKPGCWFMATNKVFGDPCVGVPKYVEVQYTCV